MKKVIVLFCLAFSLCAYAQDYNKYCSKNFPSKTIGGNLASLTGFNSLSRNLIESALQNAIKKETNSKFKVKIDGFWGVNILNGEFKSLNATSKKYAYNGIFLSDIKVSTICSYNHILYEDESLYFKENMVLNFRAKLTNEDINAMLNSKKLDKKIKAFLSDVSNYGALLPLIKTFRGISLPIKIDDNNKAKLRIDYVQIDGKELKFDSYIIINKNR